MDDFHPIGTAVKDRVGAGDAVLAVTAILRKLDAPWDIVGFLGNVAGAELVAELTLAEAVSGWLGGTLVYRNQIGVERRYANASSLLEREIPDLGHPVANVGELAPGQMMFAKVGPKGVSVEKKSLS